MYSLAHSGDPEITSSHSGVTTLFLFDYDSVESDDADSIFASIQTCLERSQGVCALNDSGRLRANTLKEFANKAAGTRTAEGASVGTRQFRSMAPSVAAMWTDRPENIDLFHDYLNRHTVPRYQGAVLLDDTVSYEEFLGFCGQCAGTSARPERIQRIIWAVFAAGHGLRRWLQGFYTNSRETLTASRFKRVTASIGVVLMLAALMFLITRNSADAPLAGQTVTPVPMAPPLVPEATDPAVTRTVGVVSTAVNNAVEVRQSESAQPKSPDLLPKNPAHSRIPAAQSLAAPYTIQVGSFRSSAYAGRLVRQLQQGGYPAFASSVTLAEGDTMHRVRVGGFQNRKEATVFGEKLKRSERRVTGFFVAANK